jgi:DNA repair protein RadC
MKQGKLLQGIVEPPVNTQLRWKHPADAVSLFPQDEGLPQEDGEMTAVEHILSEQKNITFVGESLTGKVKIKTAQDVAFLFKNLESAASENVFTVLHKKDGTYTVLYVSTGTSTQSLVDIKQIVTAANELGATAVTLVHNHPSGSLNA